MPSVITVAPATDPISLAEAKAFLRVDSSDEDDIITSLISAATAYATAELGQQLVTATRRLRMDAWPSCGFYELDHPPLATVTGITYVDTGGDTQTVDTDVYDVDTDWRPGRVRLAYNESWPDIRSTANAITTTYTCGYGAAAAVDDNIISAMQLLITGWFDNRLPHGEGSSAVDALLGSASHGRYP